MKPLTAIIYIILIFIQFNAHAQSITITSKHSILKKEHFYTYTIINRSDSPIWKFYIGFSYDNDDCPDFPSKPAAKRMPNFWVFEALQGEACNNFSASFSQPKTLLHPNSLIQIGGNPVSFTIRVPHADFAYEHCRFYTYQLNGKNFTGFVVPQK